MIHTKASGAPCLDCQDRTPSCHGECERYKAWNEEHIAYRTRIMERKSVERRANDRLFERIYESKKRR